MKVAGSRDKSLFVVRSNLTRAVSCGEENLKATRMDQARVGIHKTEAGSCKLHSGRSCELFRRRVDLKKQTLRGWRVDARIKTMVVARHRPRTFSRE